MATYTTLFASTTQTQTSQNCWTCPSGAICNGADTTTDGLRAQQNYYGVDTTNRQVKFYLCPSGYCCNNGIDGCSPYNFCAGKRTGLLCGQCPDEMGLVFFSEHCIPNDECNDTRFQINFEIVLTFFIFQLGCVHRSLYRSWDRYLSYRHRVSSFVGNNFRFLLPPPKIQKLLKMVHSVDVFLPSSSLGEKVLHFWLNNFNKLIQHTMGRYSGDHRNTRIYFRHITIYRANGK